ncbi:MAG: PAS domain-containing protein [Chloroflexi bacterium]|nr:MAG: PAS domain-containing protein [Chloroflexota bacterium]
MEPDQPAQLEHILRHMSVGVAILDCSDLRLHYANPFLLALLEQLEPSGHSQDVVGHCLDEILPDELRKIAVPVLQQVCSTGQHLSWSDIPFEGFLAARGRTYWRVSVERTSNTAEQLPGEIRHADDRLLVAVEDVTELARSRLYVNAIDSISSAIAGPYALPQVLDRILQAVQEMVGSTRCAILLIDHSVSGTELLQRRKACTCVHKIGAHN